jgi:valyl-tRNA synthetase
VGYDDFDFIIPAQAARNFAVNIFASHYLEIVKNRAYNGDKAVFATLHTCLKAIIKILYPIIPFVTYKIYDLLYAENIQFSDFPKKVMEEEFSQYLDYSQLLIDFNSQVWKYKHDHSLSLKEEVKIKVPKELDIFKDDLVIMHNLK